MKQQPNSIYENIKISFDIFLISYEYYIKDGSAVNKS